MPPKEKKNRELQYLTIPFLKASFTDPSATNSVETYLGSGFKFGTLQIYVTQPRICNANIMHLLVANEKLG